MPKASSFLRLLVLLFALIPSTTLASMTTGTIKGVTVDEGGLPIPGVVITIKSPNLMGVRQLETDADGRFRFIELPPGVYDGLAEKAGFAKVSRPNLQVKIGRNTIITIEMPLATAGEEMVVQDRRPVIDTESANVGTVMTKEFLQRIPAGRSYQAAVQMAAGVTGGSNPNVAGAAYNENTYMLDGVNITDPVTGTFSLNFNFDAIEQIEVLTTGFDPEYKGLGGVINIVTESGGNTLTFKTGLYHTNGNWSPKLDARYAADGSELAPTDFDSRYESWQVAVKVTGPIVRDKAWFIASYQLSRTLIANVGIDLPRDFDGHYVYSKLTLQPSAAHRFKVVALSNPTTIDNTYQSDRFVEPEAQARQAQGGWVGSLQWDWFISADAFLETKLQAQKTYLEVTGVPCTHDQDLGYNPCDADELENSFDFKTPGRLGSYNAFNSDNWYYYDFDDRWRGSWQSKFSLLSLELLGSHDIKAGFDASLMVWDRTVGYTGNLYFVDLNETSYNPDTLSNYYWVEVSGPLHWVTTAEDMGFFLQDVYKPIENLTFRFGARWDTYTFHNDVGEAIVSAHMISPRFSAIWDPWADAKTKIVGSVGRFVDSGRLGVASYLDEGDYGSKLFLGEYFNGFTSAANNDYSYSPIESNITILDSTTAPRTDAFSLGVEREIAHDVALQVYYTGKFTRFLYSFDELNLIWDEDGYNYIGTGDDTYNTYYRMRTPSVARRDYSRVDLGIQKIWSDRWEMQGNYSYTSSKGSTQTSPSSWMSVAPQVEYYVNGLLYTDIKHDVAAGFAWEIPNDPWTTEFGSTLFVESGYPISRTYGNAAYYGRSYIYKQPVGTYDRAETVWTLSILVRQAIPVRKGKLKGVFELDNVTNQRQGDGAYVSYDNRWIIYSRQDPTQVTIGGEYEF